MRVYLALACLVVCLQTVSHAQKSHTKLRRRTSSELLRRANYRRARETSNLPSPSIGTPVGTPVGPPFRMTNAHSGIDGRVRQAKLHSVSPQRKSVPGNAITPNAITPAKTSTGGPSKLRNKRRLRRRRPAARRSIRRSNSIDSGRKSSVERARKQRGKASQEEPKEKKIVEEEKPTHRFARKIVEGMLRNVKTGARLIGARGNYGRIPLVDKLIDNATLIRPNIVEGFDCQGKNYGYYADQLNDCQIFHVCVNMKQIFPKLYTDKDMYQFSFICPEFTIFSQDSMVCAWKSTAVPCSEAHNLYYMNQNFFVVSNEDIKKETTARPFQGGTYPVAGTPGQSPGPIAGSVQVEGGAKTGGPLANSNLVQNNEGPLANSILVKEKAGPLADSILVKERAGPLANSKLVEDKAPLPNSRPV